MRVPNRLLLAVAVAGTASFALGQSVERQFSVDQTGAEVRVVRDGGSVTAEVSRDQGTTWRSLGTLDPVIRTQFATFDPLLRAPVTPSLVTAADDSRLFVVQFATPIIDEYRQVLRQSGADVQSFVPPQSYLVRADRSATETLTALPFVRWVGDYHPAFRLEPAILNDLVSGALDGAVRYNVLLVDRRADDAALERDIARVGGTVDSPALGGGLLTATLNVGQLLQIAQLDTVLWIDRWTAPEVDMDNALVQSGADVLHGLGTPIDGKGMTGHVYEGVQSNHPEFAAQAPYRVAPQVLVQGGSDSHGTNTAGEIYARGVHPTNPSFRGGVPFAQMWFTFLGAGNRYDIYRQIVDPTGSIRGESSTASWGGSRTTQYNSTSAAMDTAIFDHDLFVTQSQSNAGAQPSRPEAWSKNVASVGGFLHRNNTNPADDCWCSTGSIGPASDGRIGVTFSAYYDSILTTATGSGYSSSFGGTSGATPMVNGFGQLAIQLFTEGLLGYPGVTWQQRFDAKPHFTTTKALVMATTRQVPYAAATRVQQGWGFPTPGDLYADRDKMLVIDEDDATLSGPSRDVLAQGQSRAYFVYVPSGTPEFRAAMTYADPAGNPSVQSQHRVNDLDLEAVSPSGARYAGNIGLRTGPASTPSAAGREDRDTEEMVIVPNPDAGLWLIRVTVRQVVMDGHPETGAMDADYSLVVRGIGGGRDTSGLVADLLSSSPGDLRLSLSNVPSGWTTGRTFFSLDGSRIASTGNWFGLEFDLLAYLSFLFPAQAGSVFSFTNTGSASQFPLAPFAFSASAASGLSGRSMDAVVVLYDASGDVVAVSNVDRVQVQ
ncbi:MAG: S8 family serine peptidase [Planctomycetota bacterium]